MMNKALCKSLPTIDQKQVGTIQREVGTIHGEKKLKPNALKLKRRLLMQVRKMQPCQMMILLRVKIVR